MAFFDDLHYCVSTFCASETLDFETLRSQMFSYLVYSISLLWFGKPFQILHPFLLFVVISLVFECLHYEFIWLLMENEPCYLGVIKHLSHFNVKDQCDWLKSALCTITIMF